MNIVQERMLDLLQALTREHNGIPAPLRPSLGALGEAIEVGAAQSAERERDRRAVVTGLNESRRREAELRKRLRFSVEKAAELENRLNRRSGSDRGRGRLILLAACYLVPPIAILAWLLAV